MTWARFPTVAVLAAIFLVAGTTAAFAAHDPGGPSGKNHAGARPAHGNGGANDTTGVTGGAASSGVGAGTSSQAGTGATSSPLSGASTTNHHGATVTRDLPCGILTPPFGSVSATDSVFVLTPSGHATLVCKGDLPAGVGPEKAIVIEDLVCSAPGVAPTNESHTTIAPSGEVSLTCHFSS